MAGISMTDRQRAAWLRLSRCTGVGPATFRDLINHFSTAERALEELPDMAARAGRKRVRIPSADEIEREVEALHRFGGRLICSGEPHYPSAMLAYDGAPMVLSVVGDPDVLTRPMIGIVGSRNASAAGARLTRLFAQAFGEAGYVVVSGMARGIDSAAHEASILTGTVAAFAGGVNVVFPPENDDLAKRLVDAGGAVVSEVPLGHKPRAKDFPRRNRIIASASLGTLVVEAALRSGSLITARLANEMGRTVFAVPGSPLDPRSEGTNKLIRDGATFTTEPDDVLRDLAPMTTAPAPVRTPFMEREDDASPAASPDESDRARVISALDHTPVHVDEIVRFTRLPLSGVQLVLLELDLAGRIERHAGNRVSLT